MNAQRAGDIRGADVRSRRNYLQETEGARALLLASCPVQRGTGREQRHDHRADVVPTDCHTDHATLIDRRNHHCVELEHVMNPIEKVMVRRSSSFKLAVAVAALVLVLWATGSAVQSLWITPVIIVVAWIAIQFGLRYRHRRGGV